MNLQTLIDQLLFEEEGNTLDFKSEQYRFSGAPDHEKSELLKDIMAFANAWRRTDAYILIGVKEVKGGRSEIIGISDHIDDAHLQEFINCKTQRPIDFSYKTVQHEGTQIGIIHIPVQRRPFYLKKDFAQLKKSQVYVRRGSSTAIATIDEISTMGSDNNGTFGHSPSLEVFLIRGEHNEIVEKRFDCKLINLQIPSDEEFPDYGDEQSFMTDIMNYPNQNYYRDIAKYFQAHFRVSEFKLGIRNSGSLPARDVKVIFDIVNEDKTSIACRGNELPKTPKKRSNVLINRDTFNNIMKTPNVSVDNKPNGWRITCYLGKIQPKDMSITNDSFYLGAITSKLIQINAKVFSDDLPEPKQETLEVRFDVEDREYSDSDFLKSKQ